MRSTMPDRRTLLLAAASTAFAPALARAAATTSAAKPTSTGEPARLNALFDQFVAEGLDRSPESVTYLGMDKGARAGAKSRLDDRSLAASAADKARTENQLARLRRIDRRALSGLDAVNYDTVAYPMEIGVEANRKFAYGGSGAGAPYVISQLTGAYQAAPDFLDSQHAIDTKADAEAYLARLEAFGTALDQETEQARHDARLGVIPPDFIIDKTLIGMGRLRDSSPADSVLTASLVRRTKEKAIAGDWGAPAARLVTEKVYPALDRQMALFKDWRPTAVHTAGVGRLKDGAEYYAISLRQSTTTTMTPAEVHRTGRELVTSLSAEIDAILKGQGMTQGTVGARLRALYQDPKFRYPNTDEGKAKLIADLNVKVQKIRAKLPGYFKTLPKANLDIRRVPKYTEAGAPGGYYNGAALDGSRPGAYYINLRDTAEVPSWAVGTLTYHEGIPGHHLQISLSNEADLPLIRKTMGFNAYQEGWALYAEQLAVEMGMFEGDAFGQVGQLHDALFRAVRLVVDSGLHAMDWSREQAITYAVQTLGDQDATLTTEVERYCVWPGQASSYMVGKLTWLDLRAKAKAQLGPKFDLGEFHDAGLLSGAMPLDVLKTAIGDYVATKKG